MASSDLDPLRAKLRRGLAIPAHPLALSAERRLDERRQRALSRYYLEAGAGGLAVGVHTTQFAIHEPRVGLYRPVLELAAEEAQRFADGSSDQRDAGERPVLVAGIVGGTPQAVREAQLARSLGYDCGLLSVASLKGASEDDLVAHAEAVAREIPLFGFYLQPAAGGRELSHGFWRRFCDLDAAVAIKVAAFDRYRTIDVARAVAESGRSGEIALYTGNDDSILLDLLTPYSFPTGRGVETVRFVGGLLGQWAVWTRRAVEMLGEVKRVVAAGGTVPAAWLERNVELTDANGAVFDAANGYRGCIPGIHEVLRRQGLLAGRWCLDPRQELSPGQSEEIERVMRAYPRLTDEEWARERVERWLR